MTELIVALDGDVAHAGSVFFKLNRELGHRWFKVGKQMLLQHSGMIFIENMLRDDANLMLDLKVYDTADTVRGDVERAFALGIKFLTVHPARMKTAMEVRPKEGKILAVPSLTDYAGHLFRPFVDHIEALKICDGVVCSMPIAEWFRHHEVDKEGKILVCPGVRLNTEINGHWPSNVFTPFQAKNAGADYIVVGRPIVNAVDPAETTRIFLDDLSR